MQVQRDLSFGVIGWGYWGPKIARNLEALPQVKVTMIADLDARRLQALEIPQGIATTTQSEDILCSDVDGVVIASPVCTHYQLARQALVHGKHVLVEKPLTDSVEEAEDLVKLACQRERMLMVGHTFEYSPAINELKRLIDLGELGRIYYIEMERVNLGLFRDDIDVIWDLAPHDISILLYLLGQKPARLAVQTWSHVQSRLAETAHLDLSFADNIYAHIHISWLHPCKVRRITLMGALGSAMYDATDQAESIKIYDRRASLGVDQRISYHVGAMHIPHIDRTEPLRLECEDFVRAIRTGHPPRASGEAGLEVVRVLTEIQRVRAQQEAERTLRV